MARKIFFLVGIVYFSFFGVASANITINEIMYDLEGTDTDREWIEVYNSGSEAVDFSSYKLFEADTNHGLVVVQGDKNISPGGYGVIVSNKDKFKIDWPNFSGAIFDSSFSLNNDGEAIAIKDANLNIVDSYTYSSSSGAQGNTKSLQKISNSWTEGEASPGAQNISSSTNQNSNTTTNSNENQNTNTSIQSNNTGTESGGTTSAIKKFEIQKIKAKIMAESLIFAGIPSKLTLVFTGYFGETLKNGKVFLNFGDGDSKEGQIADFDQISHTYFYPGEYNLTLEYFQNNYTQIPDAKDLIGIKVVPATVLISSVGTKEDFFVELSNPTDYEVDISRWILASGVKNFILPRGTSLTSKQKIILSPHITSFTSDDEKNLKLFDSAGGLVYDFGAIFTKTNLPRQKIISKNTTQQIPEKNLQILNIKDPENLSANSISSNVSESIGNQSFFMIFGLVILIGVGATSVYFIRKKRDVVNGGDDYDIA